jgi:hypothetical protein
MTVDYPVNFSETSGGFFLFAISAVIYMFLLRWFNSIFEVSQSQFDHDPTIVIYSTIMKGLQ